MIIPKDIFNKRIACAIFFMLVVLSTSQAYTNLEIDNARCVGNGRFTLTVLNRFNDPVALQNTEIILAHPTLGTFPVQGSWDKESVFPGTTRSQVATFTSTTGNVNSSGGYTGVISFDDCKYPPCKRLFGFDHCPEFKYNCEMNKLAIDQCIVRERDIWVKFSGLNEGQHEHLDPRHDLLLSINSNARTIIRTAYLNNTQFIQQGADKYILKIPRHPGEKLYSIQLHINKCKNDMDPTPAMCVINLEPLVERKLRESISQENASVGPPTQIMQGENQQNRSGEEQQANADARDTREVVEGNTSAGDREITPSIDTAPAEQEKREEERIREIITLLMAVVGVLWLLGLIVVLVLLAAKSS